MSQQSSEQLYWPYASGVGRDPAFMRVAGWIYVALGIGLAVSIVGVFFLPIGILYLMAGKKLEEQISQHKRLALEATHSVLMSRAEYVGGHPLIPEADTVVLGLSQDRLTIYSFGGERTRPQGPSPIVCNSEEKLNRWTRHFLIQPSVSIPLRDIIQPGMGRPKRAREVYDEDFGYTVDVYEQAPFLSIVFRLNAGTYRASFQSFDSETPQQWYNQITALKYQLDSSRNGQHDE